MIDDTIYFHDFYLNFYEFRDYAKYDFSKYYSKAPEWLNIQPQTEKKLQEIVELGLYAYAFNGLDYSFNS